MKDTYSFCDKFIKLWTLKRQAKIFLRIWRIWFRLHWPTTLFCATVNLTTGKREIDTYTNFVVSGKTTPSSVFQKGVKSWKSAQEFNLIGDKIKKHGSDKRFDTKVYYKIGKFIESVKSKMTSNEQPKLDHQTNTICNVHSTSTPFGSKGMQHRRWY